MSYTLIIREEALEEMKDAFLYYERAQTGLGERFLFELEKRYNEILFMVDTCQAATLHQRKLPSHSLTHVPSYISMHDNPFPIQ